MLRPYWLPENSPSASRDLDAPPRQPSRFRFGAHLTSRKVGAPSLRHGVARVDGQSSSSHRDEAARQAPVGSQSLGAVPQTRVALPQTGAVAC